MDSSVKPWPSKFGHEGVSMHTGHCTLPTPQMPRQAYDNLQNSSHRKTHAISLKCAKSLEAYVAVRSANESLRSKLRTESAAPPVNAVKHLVPHMENTEPVTCNVQKTTLTF